MTRQALLIFAKNAEPGKVKTRLAATIGVEAALNIYHQLLLLTASATAYLPVRKFVFYSSYIANDDVWDSNLYTKELQHGADLGERMKNAFADLFTKRLTQIVIIGVDCPALNADLVMEAFSSLQSHDVVIGPATDGGYYLLGLNQLQADLFDNIRWSTNTVFDDTLKKLKASDRTYHILPVLSDVDEEKDLKSFEIVKT